MQELDSDEKVRNDESCHVYFPQVPFIPVPNACKLLMIPTVKWKQQIWLCQALSCGVGLLTACWGLTVGGTNVFITPLSFLSRWGRGESCIWFMIYYYQSERLKNSVDVSHFDVVSQSCAQTYSILHLSLILGDNGCLYYSKWIAIYSPLFFSKEWFNLQCAYAISHVLRVISLKVTQRCAKIIRAMII